MAWASGNRRRGRARADEIGRLTGGPTLKRTALLVSRHGSPSLPAHSTQHRRIWEPLGRQLGFGLGGFTLAGGFELRLQEPHRAERGITAEDMPHRLGLALDDDQL